MPTPQVDLCHGTPSYRLTVDFTGAAMSLWEEELPSLPVLAATPSPRLPPRGDELRSWQILNAKPQAVSACCQWAVGAMEARGVSRSAGSVRGGVTVRADHGVSPDPRHACRGPCQWAVTWESGTHIYHLVHMPRICSAVDPRRERDLRTVSGQWARTVRTGTRFTGEALLTILGDDLHERRREKPERRSPATLAANLACAWHNPTVRAAMQAGWTSADGVRTEVDALCAPTAPGSAHQRWRLHGYGAWFATGAFDVDRAYAAIGSARATDAERRAACDDLVQAAAAVPQAWRRMQLATGAAVLTEVAPASRPAALQLACEAMPAAG